MIADSDKQTFEAVLVYQLDRFARNRYDSAINKAKLKKNGVRVISAKENITDDASGILVEGVLESMAEYYSAELSQKIRRGMDINAQKCLSNGSLPGLGFKVDADRKFYVDPEEAAVVREIYERYASGETVAEITRDLNARQIKTAHGKEFNKNSLHRILRNKRYIGVYLYKDMEIPGGMPRIIEDELFERVQHILNKNKQAPGRTRGKEEYLLTTKLFCGYCREMMTGYGGTSRNKNAYHYYSCKNSRKNLCDKKIIKKEKIEDRVVSVCRKLLTDENIEKISKSVAAACQADYDGSGVKRIKAAIRETEAAIENLWIALEKGQSVDMITERIEKRKAEKAELEAQLAIEMNKQVIYTEPQIRHYLISLRTGDLNDINIRRGFINIFVRAIYLYDDKMTIYLNSGDKETVIDDILIDETEEYFDSLNSALNGGSAVVASVPPMKTGSELSDPVFLYLDKLIFSCAEAEIGGGFNGAYAVAAFDSFNKMRFARVGGCINKVYASLIDCNRVIGNENADISNAGVFRFCTAVAVNAHVFHNVNINDISFEQIDNGFCGICHGIKERIVVGCPEVCRVADSVDITLAV